MKRRAIGMKWLSWTLAAVTFAGTVPFGAAASAEGSELPVYQASGGFSGTQGGHQWRYQYKPFDSSSYKDLPVYAGNIWWKAQFNWDWGKIADKEVTPGSLADTARTFVAPESGSVTVKAAGPVTISPGTYGGARLKVMKNEEQIWPTDGEWAPLNANQTIAFPEIAATVAKGDRLYFVANSGADHANGQDDIRWDPIVAYSSVTASVSPSSVTLDRHELRMNVDDTETLVATVSPADASNKRVYWTSSDPRVATVENGVVTAVSNGTATITATTLDGERTDSAEVVAVGSPSFRASEGYSGVQGANHWRYQYRPFDSAELLDLPTFSGDKWWKSANNWDWGMLSGSVVTPGTQAETARTFVAPESGLLTVKAAKPIGIHPDTYGGARLKATKNGERIWPLDKEWEPIGANQTIDFPSLSVPVLRGDRISFVADSGADHANGFDDISWDPVLKYAEVTPTVSPVSVALDRHALTPGIGESVTLAAEIAPADATNKRLYWTSSNPQVATVKDGRVTAIGPGTATITATTADGGWTDQAVVTVDGDGATTRYELLFMLVKALKLPADVPYRGAFGDVSGADATAGVLQSAYDNGLIDGHLIENGMLHPQAAITNEVAASMLIRGYNRASVEDAKLGSLDGLTDRAEIGEWAIGYAQADRLLGIVHAGDAYPDAFEPQDAVTRFEALAMIDRLLASMDIQGMIAKAIAEGRSKVVIPPNTYRIAPKTGSVILPIVGAHDLEIVADGVTVVGTKLTTALSVGNSTNVKISGMTINYDPLPFTQGRIVNIAEDLSYLDISLDAGYPRKLYSRLTIYDPVARFQKRGINHLWGTKASWNPDGTVRISLAGVGTNAAVGDLATLAGGPESGGIPHGITVGGSSGIAFKNVTLHTAPGFGFLEAGSEGGTVLDGFKLVPGPAPAGASEAPLLTAVWDGIQFKTSKKGPIVENSVIRNAGDDSFSIQSGDFGVVKAQGDEIVIVLRDGSQAVKPGDRLKRFNDSSEAIVVSQEKVPKASLDIDPAILQKIASAPEWTLWRFTEDNYYRIKLDRTSPFAAEDFIFSPDRMGNGFVFRNNDIYSPGRGMLLKAGDGLVENNVFRGGDKAIIVSPEAVSDSHAGAAQNLMIRNNRIIETGYHHYMPWSDQAGAVGFAGGNARSEKAFSNIVIENNTFEGVNGLNLNLSNVSGAVVRGNTFLRTHLSEPGNNGADKGIDPTSVIYLSDAENILFEGNVIDRMGPYGTLPVNARPSASGVEGAGDGVTVLHPAPANALAQVAIAASETWLQPGQTASIRLSGKLTNGYPTALIGATVTYETSNARVATVDATGHIAAVSEGAAFIRATVTWNGTTVQSAAVKIKVTKRGDPDKPGKPAEQ